MAEAWRLTHFVVTDIMIVCDRSRALLARTVDPARYPTMAIGPCNEVESEQITTSIATARGEFPSKQHRLQPWCVAFRLRHFCCDAPEIGFESTVLPQKA